MSAIMQAFAGSRPTPYRVSFWVVSESPLLSADFSWKVM